MPAAGDLKATPIADVLRPLAHERKSGTLRVEKPPVQKTIVFNEGRIWSSSSNDPRETLARFLMRDGVLGEDALVNAINHSLAEGTPVGTILVDTGLLSDEQLRDILEAKAKESVHDLFLWPDGRYEFQEGVLPSEFKITVHLDVDELLHEGARRVHEWVHIRKTFPHMLRTAFKVIVQPREVKDPRELHALSLASLGHSLGEIVAETYGTEYEICRMFLGFQARGVVAVEPFPADKSGPRSLREVLDLMGRARERMDTGSAGEAAQLFDQVLTFDSLNLEARRGLQEARKALQSRVDGGADLGGDVEFVLEDSEGPAPQAPPPPVPRAAEPDADDGWPESAPPLPAVAPAPTAPPPGPAPPAPAPAAAARPRPRPSRSTPGWPVLAGGGLGLILLLGGGYWLSHRGRPPVLESAAPVSAKTGDSITLNGSGFDDEPAQNTVMFGSRPGQVTSATDTALVVVVPKELKGREPFALTAATRHGRSAPLSFKLEPAPTALGIEPDIAMPGDLLTVKGQDLDVGTATVTVADLPAKVQDVTSESFRVRLPDMSYVPERTVTVSVRVGAKSQTFRLGLARLPEIRSVSPVRAMPGERVTIQGRGFDPEATGNLVTFGGQAGLVLTATSTELTVAAPGLPGTASAAEAPVVVQALGRTPSAPIAFSLSRPTTENFALRFYAAPVPEHPTHEHALVATELGPVLLVTGKGDASTAAERAQRIAAALNTVLRDGGAIGFGSGSGQVPRPIDSDAAGYGEPWSSAAREHPPSVDDVVAWWGALLEDYRTLLVKGERPARSLALSPRADVLAELYDRIVRARPPARLEPSPEATPAPLLVLTKGVLPVPPELQRRLRDLALGLPSGAATGGPVGMVGSWQGTVTDGAGNVTGLDLKLTMDGARLKGVGVARGSSGSNETPLEELAYQPGELRFKLGARWYVAAVKGDSISGTVRNDAAGKSVAGRFALRQDVR